MLSPGIRVAKDNAQNLTEQRDALPAGIRLTEAEIAKTKESLGSRLSMLTQNLVGRNEKEVLGGGLDRFLSVLLNGIGKLLGF